MRKLIIGLVGYALYCGMWVYYFSLIDPGPCIKSHSEIRHRDAESHCLPTESGVVECRTIPEQNWTEEVCDKWENMK